MSDTEIREFPTAVIASLATGVLLCNGFSKVHQAAEFLMGHPIWTHHFANKEFCASIRSAIAKQCPSMPLEANPRLLWREQLESIEGVVGKTVTIRKGNGATAMSPLQGL